jgi:hypothetical protein
MTKEQYDEEVTNSSAEELIDFYYEMEEKYGTYWKPMVKLRLP